MGKAKRITCIATPMLLSVTSLICFLAVAFAQVSPNGQRSFYFFKADTSSMMLGSQSPLNSLPSSVIPTDISDALESVAKSGNLKDFYTVGLFGYCEGDLNTDSGRETVTHCSAWKLPFSFDPVAVWRLENTRGQANLGERFTKGIKIYRKTVELTHHFFVAVLAFSVSECVVGMLAIKSRWGSFCTTIVAFFQTTLAIATAVIATFTYIMLKGVFESVLRPSNIEGSLGVSCFSILWLGVACSISSCFFWFWSVCWCSGE